MSVLFTRTKSFNIISTDDFEDGSLSKTFILVLSDGSLKETSIKLEISDHKIQIVHVYAPNNSADRKCFNSILSTILDYDYIHILGAILTAHKIIKLTETQIKIIKIWVYKNWTI